MRSNVQTRLVDGTKPATPKALFQKLSELEILYKTVFHEPLFTVEEAQATRTNVSGGFTKNLFLKNKKGEMWLLVCQEGHRLNLKTVAKDLKSNRLSFGSPNRLMQFLGVLPGAVTPFSAINDRQSQVLFVLDRSLLKFTELNFHPLDNTMTTRISTQDLLRFLEYADHSPQFIDL